MPLVPYLRYEVISPRTPSEVQAALRGVVEPTRFFCLGAGTRPFEGEVEDRTFDLQLTIRYRNAFLPRIRGTIDATPEGSRIGITMRPNLAVLVFTTVWLGFVAVGCGAFLVSGLSGRGPITAALGPAGMFVLGWTVAAGAFTLEAKKATHLLADVMRADPTAGAGEPRVNRSSSGVPECRD